MAITITPVQGLFEAEVTPPHGSWSTTNPLRATDLIAALSQAGCHSTDITDALDNTGLSWRAQHDAEVHRRRGE